MGVKTSPPEQKGSIGERELCLSVEQILGEMAEIPCALVISSRQNKRLGCEAKPLSAGGMASTDTTAQAGTHAGTFHLCSTGR